MEIKRCREVCTTKAAGMKSSGPHSAWRFTMKLSPAPMAWCQPKYCSVGSAMGVKVSHTNAWKKDTNENIARMYHRIGYAMYEGWAEGSAAGAVMWMGSSSTPTVAFD
jgi:hypothetical protein